MIITLLSDWGTKDATVAHAKALLSARASGVEVVDISHHITRHSQRQAAYILSACYNSFPVGSVHICPVAVFVGKSPAMIIAFYNGHYFIAPDNGLLPLALGSTEAKLCATYTKPYDLSLWIADAARIVHAISVEESLAHPTVAPQELRQVPPPQLSPVGIECQVLYTDTYGNVVLNVTRSDFDKLVGARSFSIQTMKGYSITAISTRYTDVEKGMPLCRFNKAGLMEVAVNHGAATEMLGIGDDDIANLRYNPVRVFV